jgi:uncharacterized protein (DUF302 family)
MRTLAKLPRIGYLRADLRKKHIDARVPATDEWEDVTFFLALRRRRNEPQKNPARHHKRENHPRTYKPWVLKCPILPTFQRRIRIMKDNGLITIESDGSPQATAARLIRAIDHHGMALMARIDHAAAAQAANLFMRPTEVFIFGNPRAGTPLMNVDQRVGIDLPLKILVWEDDLGKTNISYNALTWLGERHHFGPLAKPALNAMATAIDKVAQEASGLPQQTSVAL